MDRQYSLNDTVREAIEIATIRLMEQRPLASVSVTEIVRLAGVGRTSFYRNYSGKEDVVISYLNALYRQFFASAGVPARFDGPGGVEVFLLPRVHFITEHRRLFESLHQSGLLHDVFSKMDADILGYMNGLSASQEQYALAGAAGACTAILELWIERGFRESEQELMDLMIPLLARG